MIKHSETILNSSVRRIDTSWKFEWDIDKATENDIYLSPLNDSTSKKTWYFEFTDGEPKTPGEKTGSNDYTKFDSNALNITEETKYLNPDTDFLIIENTIENVTIDPIPPSFVSDNNTEYIITDGDERYCEYIFNDETGLDYKNFTIGLASNDSDYDLETTFYDFTRKNTDGELNPSGVDDKEKGTEHVKKQLGYNKFYINKLKITSDGKNTYKLSFYLTKNVTKDMLNIGDSGLSIGKLVIKVWDKAGNFSIYRICKSFDTISVSDINELDKLNITFSNIEPVNRVCDEHNNGKILVTVYNPYKKLWNIPITAELKNDSIGQIDNTSYTAGYDSSLGILKFYVNNITQKGNIIVDAYIKVGNNKLDSQLYTATYNEAIDGPWVCFDTQNRKYNILNYVPKYLQNSDFYDFIEFFQLYLNSMYTTLDSNKNISILEKIARINNFSDISQIENKLLNTYAKEFGNEFNVNIDSLKNMNLQIYNDINLNSKDETDIYDLIKYVFEQLPTYNMYKGTNTGMIMALKMFGFCCKIINLWCKTDNTIEDNPNFIEEDRMLSFTEYFMTSRFNIELSSSNIDYKTLNDNIYTFINIIKSCKPITRILNKIKYSLIFEKNLIFTYRTIENTNTECINYNFNWNIGNIKTYNKNKILHNPIDYYNSLSVNKATRFANYISIDYNPSHIMCDNVLGNDTNLLIPTNIYSIIAKFLNCNNYRIILKCKYKQTNYNTSKNITELNTINEDTFEINSNETKALVNSGRWYIIPTSGRCKTMCYNLYRKYILPLLDKNNANYDTETILSYSEISLSLQYYPGTDYIICL